MHLKSSNTQNIWRFIKRVAIYFPPKAEEKYIKVIFLEGNNDVEPDNVNTSIISNKNE